MSHIVASGASKVYVQADVTNVRCCSRAIPAGIYSFDQDATMAEATRRKVYDMLAAEKMLVQGFHYPFPALGPCREERLGLSGGSGSWSPDDLRASAVVQGGPPGMGGLLFLTGRRNPDDLLSAAAADRTTDHDMSGTERRDAMTHLTRRALLTGAAAVSAAAVCSACRQLPAHAAAPPAGTQAPGWYRYKVGSIEVTVVTDGVQQVQVARRPRHATRRRRSTPRSPPPTMEQD